VSERSEFSEFAANVNFSSLRNLASNELFLLLLIGEIMKKIIALLFMLPILFACGDKNTPDTPPAPNPNPNPPNPPVVVTSPPRVRGFMVQTANGLHPQTIKDLSTWGANVIRLQLNPATYALKKGKDLWATLPEYLNLVEEKVRAAQSVNVKVILDLHEPPIYVNGKVPTLDDHNQRGFWANHPEMKDALIRMWKNIAQHFTKKEYENEIWGYDLFNEPSEKGILIDGVRKTVVKATIMKYVDDKYFLALQFDAAGKEMLCVYFVAEGNKRVNDMTRESDVYWVVSYDKDGSCVFFTTNVGKDQKCEAGTLFYDIDIESGRYRVDVTTAQVGKSNGKTGDGNAHTFAVRIDGTAEVKK